MDATEKNKIRANNIRAVWDALMAPSWIPNDLKDLGMAIYAHRPLKDLDQKLFERLLPHLATIVERLETKFTIPPTVAEPSPMTETNTTSAPSPEQPQKE